jgi:wyosine [tRNA(Phe)-imidazoG37] synthetase (radical SAM superfamily)
MSDTPRQALSVHRDHHRSLAENCYVYAVVSRRSKGVSIGVNLNPDKICNFDCVYCQVDRTTPGGDANVDLPRLRAELEATLDLVVSGRLFDIDRFQATPPILRRLNDIAFSGDGEPTTCRDFRRAVEEAAAAKAARGLTDVKLVLITNATMLHRPEVRDALAVLYPNNGEVWAKLDAGSEDYYHWIEKTTIPFRRILENITATAKVYPVIIQAMFLRLQGEPPSRDEQEAFCARLNDITRAGGRISCVQAYTVARPPADASVSALLPAEVDALVELVRQRTGLSAEGFYGTVPLATGQLGRDAPLPS